ncbi:CAP domain-containing protein [Streptomyces caniferus]|uniref:CAP domain-containing protein n=1 Tax=Streptomyces caniferus TaxID=285557 RepID=UPI0034563402
MNTKYSSTPARDSRGAPPQRVRRVPPSIVVSAGALIGALAVLSSQNDAKASEYPDTPAPTRASADEQPTARHDAPRADRYEAEALRLVNEARAEHGCEPLRRDAHLTEAARRHSQDMADRHSSADRAPNGAEPEGAFRAWRDNPEDRAEMLSCSFRTTGVGVAFDGKLRPYWTQELGRK